MLTYNVFEYVILARIGIAESGSDFVNMALKMFFFLLCFVFCYDIAENC